MKGSSSLEPEVVRLLEILLEATHLELSYTVAVHQGAIPELTVEFSGPDTAMLVARNGELLQAIEHLGAKVCGLDSMEHDLLLMEADQFKAKREAALRDAADSAAMQVRQTGEPYMFSPMSSHARRRLHLALTDSGLQTESVGTGSQRAVVLHPPHKAEVEPAQGG